ncbi:carbohydrate-binding module family 13 protein [Schizophyllum amplum]|uniref:Carbohydrate-binding module family 13 protein n=1 Tax=Schizophyllum amplum TaxID=97359 RepID=A0A550C1G9_9AGAR|nr:carbohydrate-binding module family 13 protein [Auriculariopsis ampla]
MFNLQSFVTLAIAIAAANAQAPVFQGELFIQPGLSSGVCLTAASNSDGAAVSISPCVSGAAAQKWTFDGGAIKVFGDKCLDVTDGNNADGTKLQVYSCSNGSVNQQFYYNIWDTTLSWKDHGKCLDLTDGSTADGNRPQLYSCSGGNANQVWNVGYSASDLPQTSEEGQVGTNQCGTNSDQSSMCQTAWINSASDFCLWAPPNGGAIGDTEREEVAWCTKSGRGTRIIPDGTLSGVHFVKTPDYVQITGQGDFTKINLSAGDSGGELDPHGADGNGNPIGGLVFGNSFGDALQYHEWTSFISEKEFCFRACVGPNAAENCQHIYDVMGCYWNMPGNYDAGTFEDCDGDDTEPMGVYGTSTWHQGEEPTPAPHAQASSSNCVSLPTVTVSPARRRRALEMVKA